MKPFSSKVFSTEEGGRMVIFSGAINEESLLPDLRGLEGDTINIDVSDVTFINSLGIRTWMFWLNHLDDKQLAFHRVPSVLIDQFNFVDGFLPDNATVESFFVPYVCEQCDYETKMLFTKGREYSRSDKQVEPVVVACTECLNKMEMSALADRYFHFLDVPSPNSVY